MSEVGVPSGVIELVHVFYRAHRERQRVTEPETADVSEKELPIE